MLVGRTVHRLGFATFPHPPASLRAERAGDRVTVEWELAGGGRGGRHLYVTLHQDHLVLCNRTISSADPAGATSLRVPDGRQATAAMASVYNRLRQRSVPKRVEIG